MLLIDAFAQKSRLRRVNALLKFCIAIPLLIVAVISDTYITGAALALLLAVITVAIGGMGLRDYIAIIALPLGFLLLGSLAILIEVNPIRISDDSLMSAILVASRALGAVSCLLSLSLTTPMPQLIGVLRFLHCPELLVDLMYLIYRYIFILLSIQRDMHLAAASRLGFRGYRMSIRTTSKIYANLLARSYHFACKNFDAMESRCYDKGIRFL